MYQVFSISIDFIYYQEMLLFPWYVQYDNLDLEILHKPVNLLN